MSHRIIPHMKGNLMSLFKELEGDSAIVVMGGVYKQVPLYTRNGFIFAAISGGYVRLKADGTTSKDKLRIEHLETEVILHRDKFNRLGSSDIPNAKPIAGDCPLLIEA